MRRVKKPSPLLRRRRGDSSSCLRFALGVRKVSLQVQVVLTPGRSLSPAYLGPSPFRVDLEGTTISARGPVSGITAAWRTGKPQGSREETEGRGRDPASALVGLSGRPEKW